MGFAVGIDVVDGGDELIVELVVDRSDELVVELVVAEAVIMDLLRI